MTYEDDLRLAATIEAEMCAVGSEEPLKTGALSEQEEDLAIEWDARGYSVARIAQELHRKPYRISEFLRLRKRHAAERAKMDALRASNEAVRNVPLKRLNLPTDTPLIGAVMSTRRGNGGPQTLTAQIMGDPEPSRSALGRECLPHEYASKPGQGRWHDPVLGRYGRFQ